MYSLKSRNLNQVNTVGHSNQAYMGLILLFMK